MPSYNKPVYYFEVTAENCNVFGAINGFPFYKLNAEHACYFASPMNIGLVKGINKVQVTIAPVINGTPKINVKPVCKIALKIYEYGSISGPENGEKLQEVDVNSFGEFAYEFTNNSKIDFSSFFEGISKIEDTAKLKEYVSQLVKEVRKGDFYYFKKEFDYKLEQYAIAYYNDPAEYRDNAMIFFRDNIIGHLPDDYIPVDEMVTYTPFNDKKIWYVALTNGEDLFYSKPDEEESVNFVPVYIACHKGQYKIIR